MSIASAVPRVLIVGYGDLGKAIGQELLTDGAQIWGLRRSVCSHADGVSMLAGDVTQPSSLAGIRAIDPHIVVYCVAAIEQSDADYRVRYVEGLRHVLAALAGALSLQHVFFVSSSRVFGQPGNALLSESDPAMPADFGGRRLLEAELLLNGLPCGHTALRLSGIYGPGRSRMLALAAQTSQWPVENAWSNRIHRDDAAAFCVFLIHRVLDELPVDDCYIVTDSYPVPQYEVLRWLAARLGRDVGGLPSLSPGGGKRLSNARMLATGFRLRYPDYRAGYATLLA
jgi:nucleoside-diphosphate-sugar epimerase